MSRILIDSEHPRFRPIPAKFSPCICIQMYIKIAYRWIECDPCRSRLAHQIIGPQTALLFRKALPQLKTDFIKVRVRTRIAAKHSNHAEITFERITRFCKLLYLHHRWLATKIAALRTTKAFLVARARDPNLHHTIAPDTRSNVMWRLHQR